MEKMIALKLTKCELYLTEAELISLLAHDAEIWKRAIRRGKYEKRTRSTDARSKRRDECEQQAAP